MNNPSRQYHTEFFAQGLLYFLMIIGYLGGLIFGEGSVFMALIFQFFVGVFQVLSGFIHLTAFRSSIHGKYLLGVLAYFTTLGAGIWINELFNFSHTIGEFLGFVILLIIPIIIATWYLNMLTWYYGGKYPAINNSEQEHSMDILDDMQV
ncbi:MAG: hypothetical protein AB8E82_07150 [Aureispira sp.]